MQGGSLLRRNSLREDVQEPLRCNGAEAFTSVFSGGEGGGGHLIMIHERRPF